MIWRVLAALALLCAVFAVPAEAQQRKAALVIGNGAYRHAPALRNPPNDARAVAEALRRLGFEVTLVVDADRRQMLEALNGFSQRIEEAGDPVAAFYYSGYGLSVDKVNYLVPVDAAMANEVGAAAVAVDLTQVFDTLARTTDGKVIILDANRNNPFVTGRFRSTRPGPVAARGLSAVSAPPDGVVVMASAPGTVAAEGAGSNSLFTAALLRRFPLLGKDVDAAMKRVQLDVSRATKGRQVPWIHSALTSELALSEQSASQKPSSKYRYYRPLYRKYSYPDRATSSPEAERLEREREIAAERALREQAERERQAVLKKAEQERQAIEELLKAKEKTRSISVEVRPTPPPPPPPPPGQQEASRPQPTPPPAPRWDPSDMPVNSPAPAPPPASAAPDDHVDRFPTIEAADRVAAGATTTVLVSLTVDKVTPEVSVLSTGGGTSKTPEGALSLPMPADAARMDVKVVLRAAGFDLDPATPEEATIEIDRTGDSTTARFRITARPDAVGPRALRVTLWRDNEFLANISRKIEIVPARPVASDQATPAARAAVTPRTAPSARTAPPSASHALPGRDAPAELVASATPQRLSSDGHVAILARPRPIDLKIEIIYDDAGGLGRGRVTIATDYLGRMRHGEINTPPSIVGWLEEFYREFRNLSSRGAQSADPLDDDTREARIGRLRAFGEELYRRAAPPVLKAALDELLDNPQVELRTVQIYSNNPVIPWELMRAPKPTGGTTDFFGITFALARWHEDDGPRLILRPPQDQRIDEVVAIAPAYTGGQSLGAQSREIDEIQGLLATRRVAGKRSDFLTLVRNPPRGIIHFAGHGEIAGRSAVERRFAIRLEDGAFDVMDWRGVAAGQNHERALFFFNACDIGQAESVAGAVEGWAPAVLARGAAGYIGGLWPLKDDPAARFAVAFYRAVAKRLADDGEASVAGALSDARRLFYETADPTYLGYAFYGDAQLALVRR